MLTTISKTFDFDAAHRLDRLPEDHKCHRLHGHTYKVEIRVRGEPDPYTGMVIDYAVIAAAWEPIHDQIDHRDLNDVPGLEVPTTEILVRWIWARLPDSEETNGQLFAFGGLPVAVRVYESSTTWAEVP